jgi:hypothetical protein
MHAGSAVLGSRWHDAMNQLRANLLPVPTASRSAPFCSSSPRPEVAAHWPRTPLR